LVAVGIVPADLVAALGAAVVGVDYGGASAFGYGVVGPEGGGVGDVGVGDEVGPDVWLDSSVCLTFLVVLVDLPMCGFGDVGLGGEFGFGENRVGWCQGSLCPMDGRLLLMVLGSRSHIGWRNTLWDAVIGGLCNRSVISGGHLVRFLLILLGSGGMLSVVGVRLRCRRTGSVAVLFLVERLSDERRGILPLEPCAADLTLVAWCSTDIGVGLMALRALPYVEERRFANQAVL
tara:strand:- start:6387 stop:7085 length:699 start_codon:yes stop_codon:yes gene_type:complete